MKRLGESIKWFHVLIGGAFFFSCISSATFAEPVYPNRPINMIVPYAPGGAADLGSKVIADKIFLVLGQPLLSIYKPGGGGSLGAAFVSKAKPDGYTLLVGSPSPLLLSPIVKKLDYQFEDFIPIGIFGKGPIWLTVRGDGRWKDLRDFIRAAKESPGKLLVGSYGQITSSHFLIETFARQAGIKLTHVPFKSSGEAVTALLGGHLDAGFVMGASGLFASGLIRILAAAVDEKLEGLPDVPIFKNFGLNVVSNQWTSLCAPKGTPKEIVDKLYNAQKKAFERYPEEIKESLRKVEYWAYFFTPQESIRKFKEERDFLFRMAQELGVVAK